MFCVCLFIPVDTPPYVAFSGDSAIMKVDLDGNNQALLHNQATVKGKIDDIISFLKLFFVLTATMQE